MGGKFRKFAQIVINEGDVMNSRCIFVFAMPKGGDENINIKSLAFFYCIAKCLLCTETYVRIINYLCILLFHFKTVRTNIVARKRCLWFTPRNLDFKSKLQRLGAHRQPVLLFEFLDLGSRRVPGCKHGAPATKKWQSNEVFCRNVITFWMRYGFICIGRI